MKSTKVKLLIAIYVLVGIATFGHVWKRDTSNLMDGQATMILIAPVCSALWPLYWSEVFWRSR